MATRIINLNTGGTDFDFKNFGFKNYLVAASNKLIEEINRIE